VHGLNGHPFETWTSRKLTDRNDAWPWWLACDAPKLGIWSYGYESAPSQWTGKTMPLLDRASNLIEWLEATRIGRRPLVFIAHSLGGLIVKQALELGNTYDKAFTKYTQGVVFLATPHAGSDLAALFSKLGFIGRATQSINDLAAHNPELDRIGNWYREQAPLLGIVTKVYYETQPTNSAIVVDKTSSNPGIRGVLPTAVLADHISIARPSSKTDIVYLGTYQFIQDLMVRITEPSGLPGTENLLNHPSELVAILALAEKMKAEIAVGKTDNLKHYAEIIELLERRAKGIP